MPSAALFDSAPPGVAANLGGFGAQRPAPPDAAPAASPLGDAPPGGAPLGNQPLGNQPRGGGLVGGSPAGEPRDASTPVADAVPTRLSQTLIYSGLASLAVAGTGLLLVGRWRRQW